MSFLKVPPDLSWEAILMKRELNASGISRIFVFLNLAK